MVGLAQTLGGIQIEGAGLSGYLCFRVFKAESAAAWPCSEGQAPFAGRKRKGKLQRRSACLRHHPGMSGQSFDPKAAAVFAKA